MKIGSAQINPPVGDLAGNHRKILESYRELASRGADLVLAPELAITGYPPQDLVFKSRFVSLTLASLDALHGEVGGVPLLVGFIDVNTGSGQPFHNAAALLQQDHPRRVIYKALLPTYDVFDEDRYFEPGSSVAPVDVAGTKIGVTICEDIWTEKYLPRRLYGIAPVDSLVAQGARLLVNISASPFAIGKPARRVEMLGQLASHHRIPIAYCNAVGGNDQLVFDCNSLAIATDGSLRAKLEPFAEDLAVIDTANDFAPITYGFQGEPEELYDALCLGLRDYVVKCGFKSVVLGLSGGIDSAVTAALAVHALGADKLLGANMPTQYSSAGSIDDSRALARNLGIRCLTISIMRSF